MLDKIKGTLIGLAVGDALGAPHEFRNQRSNIYTGILYLEPFYKFRFSEITDVIGQYTDDTEMTLVNLRSVLRKQEFDEEDIILSYERWAKTAKALGRNMRELFKGIKTVRGFRNRWRKKYENTEQNNWTQSNGCLMLCFLDLETVLNDCRLTNPHPICVDACKVYHHIFQDLINMNNINKDEIVRNLLNVLETDEVSNIIRSDQSSIKKIEILLQLVKVGYCMHFGIPCIVFIILTLIKNLLTLS